MNKYRVTYYNDRNRIHNTMLCRGNSPVEVLRAVTRNKHIDVVQIVEAK